MSITISTIEIIPQTLQVTQEELKRMINGSNYDNTRVCNDTDKYAGDLRELIVSINP